MTTSIHTRRWTRQEVLQMAEAGILRPDERVELIEGEIITMTPRRSQHAAVISKVEMALQQAFGDGFFIRVQMPLALTDLSEPEPDIAVVSGAPDDYMNEHPGTALLVVEVADGTLSYDQNKKSVLYATHGIPEYWVINLPDSRVHVFREPKNGQYQTQKIFHGSQKISPLHAREREFPISKFLPPGTSSGF